MSEINNKCCGCENVITGTVIQRDSGITMCEKCNDLARTYLDDGEELLTEYEQMLENMIDKRAESIGMKNAGWKQTESGVFYYPDDDNPDIIHLGY